MKDIDKKWFNGLLLASATLFFLPLGWRALWDSDEGRYAEIAREMLELKSWVVPHLNYVLYFEKPPLMYWLTALSMTLFGRNAFAARFWCAAFGVLTVAVTMRLGREWKNDRVGMMAGGILATSLGFFALTQFLVLDMALTFWTTLTLLAAGRILRDRAPEDVRKASHLAAVAVAGGILTKGPVALVLPGAAFLLAALYTRMGAQLKKIPWKGAAILCGAIAAPWFVVVSLRHPFFVPFFFIHEHVARFLTTVHHREAPFYFFIPVLFGGLLPWSFFFFKVGDRWLRHPGRTMKRDPVAALLVIWSLLVFIFFSLSQSKLFAYVLPIYPAAALLLALEFDEACAQEFMPAWLSRGLGCLIALLIGFLALLKWPRELPFLSDPMIRALWVQSGPFALVLAFSVFIFVGIGGMRRALTCFGGILMVQVLLLAALSSLSIQLDPFLSSRTLAYIVQERSRPEDKVVVYGVSYENHLQTLPFYAKRRVAVYGDPGELELGSRHAADAAVWFASESSALEALLHEPAGTWGITDEEHWNALEQSPSKDLFAKVAQEGRLLLFQKTL